jgi:OFA family oxalate/formate antiporter-like MFS transporter
MVLSGWLLPRLGPRRCALAGGLLFGGGWMLASLGALDPLFTAAGIGLVAGVGVGFAYIVPIAVGVQWFPRHKGLVTGVAVAGFGGGAALIGSVASALMRDAGKSPYDVFGLLGLIFLLLVSAGALAMQLPADTAHQDSGRLPMRAVVRRPGFGVLYGAMAAGLAAGFAVNANLKQLSFLQDPGTGASAVALFALANAAGRIAWGALFDRASASGALRLNLGLQAATLLAFPLLARGEAGFLAFASLAGFNYGGVLVLYASSSARLWGSRHVGQIYGLLFSSNIAAAPVPVLTGLLYDRTGSFGAGMTVLAVLLLAALAWTSARAAVLNTQAPPAG